MEEDRSEGESEIDSDFEFNDDIKQSLNCLLEIPLEFESSSDEHDDDDDDEANQVDKRTEETERTGRSDSVDRNLKALFAFGCNRADVEDLGLENISDNELDGPESGECDSSDGELPDSPTLVRKVPEQGSLVGESDVELVGEYTAGKEFQKVPQREIVVNVDSEKQKGLKKKKDKNPSKAKEKSLLKKVKEKKEKSKKSKVEEEDDLKNQLKVKKYLARIEQYRMKCIEYVSKMANKCDNLKKTEAKNTKPEKRKHSSLLNKKSKIRSVVEKVVNERETSPHSSTSSKIDQLSHSSRSSKAGNASVSSKDMKLRKSPFKKVRKSKSSKISKSGPEDKYVLHYANYIKYLQSEREKCFEESLKKHKHKSKKKHKKRDSSSPEKVKDKFIVPNSGTKVLTYDEFCNSREFCSPSKEKHDHILAKKPVENNTNSKNGKSIPLDSALTKIPSNQSDTVDDENELFVTYSDLVEQDKKEVKKKDEKDYDKIEEILQKDPEMKSISVFTSVLFKTDSNGIPFLQEGRPPSPTMEALKPKSISTQFSGPDEIYDCDDLSSISQSSLSPSRSPAPKIHNQALLNFLENQKVPKEPKKQKLPPSKIPRSRSSRSHSRSPKKDLPKLKKRKSKQRSSASRSPTPPPPKLTSPEIYKLRTLSPNHLKKRWKDYPSPPPERRKIYTSCPPDRRKDYSSPPDRRKEYYERTVRTRRRSRSRVRVSSSHSHRSRSSSEERYHSRRHHCPSRSRSRSRSRTPPPIMVNIEKRRKLKEAHERALASLRAASSMRKTMSTTPMSTTFTIEGDSYKPVMDNYEPVGMNEDSSQSEVETSPPLPPELPQELAPPVPPPGPGAVTSEDLTVVTTYTSFLPITPPNHPPPPMGYIPRDMNPYNNWMGPNMPARDMGPNMYRPPQYYNPPPQQQFPYLNQPPPQLPYQMQRYHHPPPHCHQRFRGLHQGPPSNMNFVNVHQEITNVNLNPIVITQIPDSDNEVEIIQTHDIPKPINNNSKCKHSPLGQNNHTVQEAIDSVKKCLKNCDVVKNKDPRLAAVQDMDKSPDKNDHVTSFTDKKGQPDETKVKITMNYKPRPVSSVDVVSCFEPEVGRDMSEKNFVDSESKANNVSHSDRSCKIEGIVSKLKDTIIENSSKSDDPCEIRQSNILEDFPPGDELYDPFTHSEENVQEPKQEEACVSKKPFTSSDKSPTSTSVRELSPASVERISHEIDEAFAFIFANALERKRLTPTLDEINAQKAEDHKKLNLTQSQLKQSPLLVHEKDDNTGKDIDPCDNKMNIITDSNTDTKSPTPNKDIEEQQLLLTHNTHELHTSPTVLDQKLKSGGFSEKNRFNSTVNENLGLDKNVDDTTNICTSLSNPSKANDKYENKIQPCSESNLLEKNSSYVEEKNTADNAYGSVRSPAKAIENDKNAMKDKATEKKVWQETVSVNKHKTDKVIFQTLDSNIEIKPEILGKSQDSVETEMNKQFNIKEKKEHLINTTQSLDESKSQCIKTTEDLDKTKDESKTDEKNNLATNETIKINEDKLLNSTVRNEYFLSSLKQRDNNERRGIPCLSIPTKGELKRFPTPERIGPQENKLQPDTTSAFNTATVQNKDKSKNKKEIAKHFHSKTVESILNDFEDSSSAGSDFQEARKVKEMIFMEKSDLSSLQMFGMKGKTPLEHNIGCGVPLTDLDIAQTNKSTVSNLPDFNEINTQNILHSNDDVKSECLPSNENVASDDLCGFNKKQRKKIKSKMDTETTNEEKGTVNERTRDVKEKPENSAVNKKGKSNRIKNEHLKTGCQLTNTTSRSQKIQEAQYQDGSTKCYEIVHNEFNKNEHSHAKESQDLQSLLPKTPFSFDPSCNVQPKPGPLSKKSKSYISKNLPASFDLSVDGHLIQKGFKKLKVQVAKLESCVSSPQIENSSSAEDANMEGGLNYDMSSVSKSSISLNKIDNCSVKEVGSIKNKENKTERSKKKKVSFDMNVSEIFKTEDENLPNSSKCNAEDEVSDCSQPLVNENVEPNPDGILPVSNVIEPTADGDIVLKEASTTAKSNQIKHTPEKDQSDISMYNKKIMDLLNSFRSRPLIQMQSRKCLVVSIPHEKDIPKANIREYQKRKLLLKSTKKSNNHKSLRDLPANESKTTQIELPSVKNKLETLHNISQMSEATACEIKRNNNTQSSEQNDSDLEDSFILDRELSDLAKGCLDSDSTVGGDDDSVLNFDIAASDDSSVDNEFDSKVLPISQAKLSSPQNIKKRFTRKLKSLGIEGNIHKAKNATPSNKQTLQNNTKNEEVLKTLETAIINDQEKRKSKRKRQNQVEVINNKSETMKTVKVIKEAPDIFKEVSKTCIVPGFECLESENTKLVDTVSEQSSVKLSEKDIIKDKISRTKNYLFANQESATCNKTAFALPESLNEEDVKTSIIRISEGTTTPKLDEVCDMEEKLKDSVSLIKRGHKIENSEKNVEFGSNHKKSLYEKDKGKCITNSNNYYDEEHLCETSFIGESQELENNKKHNVTGSISNVGKDEVVKNVRVEEKKHLDVKMKGRTCTETKIEEEDSICVKKNSSETNDDGNRRETKYVQIEKSNDKIFSKKEYVKDEIEKISKVSMLDQPSKLGTQKIKFTEFSECYDPGLDEVINDDGVVTTRKEICLAMTDHVLDSGNTLESDGSNRNGTNLVDKQIKVKTSKKRKSKDKVLDSSNPFETLRQTRSKSQIKSEKADTIENAHTKINHSNTVTILNNSVKENKDCESIDGSNKCSSEMDNFSKRKMEDNKILCKKIEKISRTISTESFDEPLITLKNKLLAEENEEKFHKDKTACNFFEECKLIVKQNITCYSEESKDKVNNCSSDCSNSTRRNNDVNGSEVDNVKEGNNKTLSNLEHLTNVPNSEQSQPDSNKVLGSGKREDSILPIETSTNGNVLSSSRRNGVECSLAPEINSPVSKHTIAVNPNAKEALRKKRDKAEVDAEIKRRLAEIDELEKLATTQHATVLEKIGARTRSKTGLKLTKPTNDTSTCKDSQESTVITNNAKTICSENNDGCNCIIATTTETAKEQILPKKSVVEKVYKSYITEESKIENVPTNLNFLEHSDAECILNEISVNATSSEETFNSKGNNSNKRSEGGTHENGSILSKRKDQECDKLSNQLTCSNSVINSENSKHSGQIQLFEKLTEESRKFSKVSSPPLKQQTRRTRSTITSTNKFKVEDDNSESFDDTKVTNSNRSIEKQNVDENVGKNKTPVLSLLGNSSFPLGSVRKTRNKTSMYEDLSEKSFDSSRESSPANQVRTKKSEDSQTNVSSEAIISKRTLSSTVTEPDSSTPNEDISSPALTNKHKYTVKKMKGKSKSRTEDLSSVESTLSDMFQEPNTVESSVENTFRQPIRNKIQRRLLEGNNVEILSSPTPENRETNSRNDCHENDNYLSEEIVSSSVNAVQPTTGLKKKRRKRKSFVDLLMEDSMLSVTRDFPMSPNPYILPSFYKELEISSNNTQFTNHYGSDKNINQSLDSNTLPPRPDILAQKLRLLEKLKNINRKNRKTRQCRTLVCYNEDSLPESLVESPASEGVPQNSDPAMSPPYSTHDSEKEESSLNGTSESSKQDPTKNYSCKNQETTSTRAVVLRKRGRKSPSLSLQLPKVTKDVTVDKSALQNVKDENYLKRFSEETSNSKASFSYFNENCSKSNSNMVETESTTIDSNQASEELKNCLKIRVEEPSELDNLPITSSNNIERKSSFSFDLNSSLSLKNGKSYYSSNYFSDTFTSNGVNNDISDYAIEKGTNCSMKLQEPLNSTKQNTTNEESCSNSNTKLFQEKIVCSILKAKIGKMPQFFGDSSSSEEEDFDEDIPLLIKLSQTNRNSSSVSGKIKSTITSNIRSTTNKTFFAQKKRGRKPKIFVSKPFQKRREKQLKQSSFEVFSDAKNESGSKENEELCKIFDNCDELIVSNSESRPSLRKSTRIPRNLQAPIDEKGLNNFQRLNVDKACLKEIDSKEALCSESCPNKTVEPKLFDKQITQVRKRGRPPKMKRSSQVLESEGLPKAADSQKNELEVEHSILQEESKTERSQCLINNQNCLGTKISERKEQLTCTPDENLISIHDVGEIGRLESIGKDTNFSETSFSENNELNSVNAKEETLRKTRAEHSKCNKNKQDQEHEIINDLDNAVSCNGVEKTYVAKKPTASEEQIVKTRWQRGKWLRRKQSKTVHSARSGGAVDITEDSDVSDKEDIESLLETSLNDSPPPLLKTRSRRPRNSNMDSLNTDPPHLESSFELSGDQDKLLNFNAQNSNSVEERKTVLVGRKRGRKSNIPKDLDKSKSVLKSANNTQASQSQENRLNNSFNDKECCLKNDDKQVCTRKGTRKSQFSITQTESVPLSVSSFYSNNLECNPEGKTSIFSFKKQNMLSKHEGEVTGSASDVSKNSVTDCNLNENNDDTAALSVHKETNENRISNLSETSKDRKNVKCWKSTIKRKEMHLLPNESVTETNNIKKPTKRRKNEKDDILKDFTTPDNVQQNKTSNTAHGCTSEASLWNKISGFLNKTTRSVGTQVKTKNMILKGFETSEPEVSLQSEMTLPQVIKTLFEELKTTDSSFSDV